MFVVLRVPVTSGTITVWPGAHAHGGTVVTDLSCLQGLSLLIVREEVTALGAHRSAVLLVFAFGLAAWLGNRVAERPVGVVGAGRTVRRGTRGHGGAVALNFSCLQALG